MILLNRVAELNVCAHVRRLYELRAAFDYEQLAPSLASDVTYHMAGDPDASPFVGVVQGRESVVATLRSIDIILDLTRYEVNDIIAEGLDVAVRWSCDVTCRDTGRMVHLRALNWIRLDEQMRVAEIHDFIDTAALHWVTAPSAA
jgi:ketosteroid isomerase-like protein